MSKYEKYLLPAKKFKCDNIDIDMSTFIYDAFTHIQGDKLISLQEKPLYFPTKRLQIILFMFTG